jgi:hypothetical protein
MVACQKPEAQNTFKSPHTPEYREVDVVLPPLTDIELELAAHSDL